jgi:hypothetical protein
LIIWVFNGTVWTTGATKVLGVDIGALIGPIMMGPLAKLDVANKPRPNAPAIAAVVNRFVIFI